MDNEKENTFRVLKDLPLLITSRWCSFGIHNYTQWSQPYVPKNGQYNYQHAYCACCNKMRVRKVRDDRSQAV